MKTDIISNPIVELHLALVERGIETEIEKWKDHEHIDLSVESAGLYIEIDGDDHYTNADTIMEDFKRDYFSNEDEYDTLHIPNFIVETKLDAVADALAKVINSREQN